MIQLRFVPIEQWPGEQTRGRKTAQFRSTYIQTLDLLENELNYLHAKEIVLQAFISWRDLRNDGWPRSDASFTGPGVILTFESTKGPLSFPCDRYDDWQDNLRGIALSLEALRAVDRHGVTRRAEQYQGWRKIAGPAAPNNGAMDKEADALFLAGHGLESTGAVSIAAMKGNAAARKQAYQSAAAKLHPDKPGGSHDEFVKLQEAYRILGGGQ